MSNPTELPDLDKLESLAKAQQSHGLAYIMVSPSDLRELIALARRAQPEGEAPQAEPVAYITTDKRMLVLAERVTGNDHGMTPLYAPATLSPLCGAQHADSGSIEDYNEFNRLLDELEGAKVDAHACGNDFGTGNKHQAAYENLVAYIDGFTAHAVSRRVQAALKEAAQQAAVPADCSGTPSSCPDNEGYGCHCSAPGTPEAPDFRHPVQPLIEDEHGRARFKENAIVRHLSEGKLNELAVLGFPEADWEQVAQLIGYSLDGFGTLSYVTDETYDRAAAQPVLTRAAQLDGGQEGSAT